MTRRGEVALPERERKAVAGGSITEAAAGAAAVVLSIVALAGTMPAYLASIACIALGVALLAQGGAAAARYSRMLREGPGWDWEPPAELSGGMGAELVAGGAAVVLGILAILGISTLLLLPSALIVLGGAMLLSSSATESLSHVTRAGMPERFDRLAHHVTAAASGTQVLVGIGAVVLGILALVGLAPLTLTLVGFLVGGAVVLLTGSSVSARLLPMGHR